MKLRTLKHLTTCVLALTGFALTSATADVVEIRNGTRLVGTVVGVDGANLRLATDYAGTISIKQSEIVSVSTDAPRVYRLANGTVLEGRLQAAGTGQVQIVGATGSATAGVSELASSWAPGATDPAIVALQRKWTYEVTVDVTGKNGNSDQLGTAFGARAVLTGANDVLQFYTNYNRQETDNVKSADQFRAGLDYANNFSGKYSWYVRNEGGFDRVKDIELYNVAAAGLGYDFLKEPGHILTGRAGVSYRYEAYDNPATNDVSSAGLDFGLNHIYEFNNSRLVNRLSLVPAFDDFGDFRLGHESFYEIPLSNPDWKLRLGVANDYNSKPGDGVEKLDTTYYTRLVLSFR